MVPLEPVCNTLKHVVKYIPMSALYSHCFQIHMCLAWSKHTQCFECVFECYHSVLRMFVYTQYLRCVDSEVMLLDTAEHAEC